MDDTRRVILEALGAGPVSGPDLAADLGVTRTAVWKHVEALRDAGFTIESTAEGYTLAYVPEFGGIAVEFGLDAPFEIEYHEAIASTNDRARALAESGADDVVVLADRQHRGRGRLARGWTSPSGGVWMSVVSRPALPLQRVPLLTFAATVGVTEALREAGVGAAIKWPNDVIVPERDNAKIAGVLTEMEGEANRVTWVVIGIGVNANVPMAELPAGATSARTETGPIDRRAFVQALLGRFDDLRTDTEQTLERWRALNDTVGRLVRVQTVDGTIEGEAIGITDAGELVVETSHGRTVTHIGYCEQLRRVSRG